MLHWIRLRPRSTALVLGALASCVAPAQRSEAALLQAFHSGGSMQSFWNPDNWLPAGPPGAGDTAEINNSSLVSGLGVLYLGDVPGFGAQTAQISQLRFDTSGPAELYWGSSSGGQAGGLTFSQDDANDSGIGIRVARSVSGVQVVRLFDAQNLPSEAFNIALGTQDPFLQAQSNRLELYATDPQLLPTLNLDSLLLEGSGSAVEINQHVVAANVQSAPGQDNRVHVLFGSLTAASASFNAVGAGQVPLRVANGASADIGQLELSAGAGDQGTVRVDDATATFGDLFMYSNDGRVALEVNGLGGGATDVAVDQLYAEAGGSAAPLPGQPALGVHVTTGGRLDVNFAHFENLVGAPFVTNVSVDGAGSTLRGTFSATGGGADFFFRNGAECFACTLEVYGASSVLFDSGSHFTGALWMSGFGASALFEQSSLENGSVVRAGFGADVTLRDTTSADLAGIQLEADTQLGGTTRGLIESVSSATTDVVAGSVNLGSDFFRFSNGGTLGGDRPAVGSASLTLGNGARLRIGDSPLRTELPMLAIGSSGSLTVDASASAFIGDASGAPVYAPGTITLDDGGYVHGNGVINGAGFPSGAHPIVLNTGGSLNPGFSPGTLTIDGEYVQEAGVLMLEIGGVNAGEYDVLDAALGATFLGGTIRFERIAGFTGVLGAQLDFFAGRAVSFDPSVVFEDATGLGLDFDLGTGIATITQVITPEPQVMALLAAGCAGLGWVGRRRRSAHSARASAATTCRDGDVAQGRGTSTTSRALGLAPSLAITLAVLGAAESARAALVEYELTHLSGSRWEYAFTVTNDSSSIALEEFTILFDVALYENLSVTASPADWSSLVVQPDASIPDDGFFDSLSTAGGLVQAAAASGFRVAFDFLGAGTPGPQRFDVVDPVTFEILESGLTSAVPEPRVAWLLVAAGVLWLRPRRRIAAAVLAGGVLAASAAAVDVTGQAAVSGLQLQSSVRVSRTVFEYTYKINVSNVGEDLFGVIASVSSSSPSTEIVDLNVDVGDIPAGATALSTDTFTIRHDRTVPFDPRALVWEIGAKSATPSPLRLSEVRFSPLVGDPPFAELWNSGARPIALGTFRLRNEAGQVETLPAAVSVPPGGFALVLFDGQTGVSGGAIHSTATAFLNSASGALELVGPAGSSVDRTAWGALQPASVTQSIGGFTDDPAPGASVARAPTLATPGSAAWFVASPAEVTPGSANPDPGVQVLLPFSGAIVPGPQVELAWYPVPGASSYRAQLASDASFTTIVSDQVVSAPRASISSVAAGTYFWRVQAIASGGAGSAFSAPNELSVDPASAGASALSARQPRSRRTLRSMTVLTTAATSGFVPLAPLSQHKDSRLLQLESQIELGAHGWSVDHGVFDPSDPADNMNCAAASIVMVNRYFGGRLSQDRVSYEVLRGRQPGPEQDLSYGSGYSAQQVVAGLTFALGAPPLQGNVTAATQALFWQLVQQEIDAGRPMLLGAVRANGQGHVTVLVAYRDVAGDQRISHADPWAPGSSAGKIEELRLSTFIAQYRSVFFWQLPAAQQAASDEAEMTQDSDNDGVVDFDETRRFGTDPFDADTDGDLVGDFIDVRASVFDPQFGYSLGGNASRVDIDGDGAQMELDSDSDDDNCTDGQEDFTLNGDFEPLLDETHNFDSTDKRCRRWIGTTVYDIRYKQDPFTHIRATGRLEWVPDSQGLPGLPPVFGASFVPQGDATLDLFSVLGCRFSASPNRVVVDRSAGQMDIDYMANPPEAGGGAGTGMITSLRNCQGQTFTEVIPLIVLFQGPVPLNAAEDEIKRIVRMTDQASDITIDMNYHLGPR